MSAPNAFTVVPGEPGCPHVDTQLLKYRSPTHESRVWSCPTCHRVVRQDIPAGAGDWTAPVVEQPEGLEGKPIPGTDRRGWGMPAADPVPAPRKRRFPLPAYLSPGSRSCGGCGSPTTGVCCL